MATESKRCPWPGEDPLYIAYHDEEWGVPEYDDRALFEKLILDGFQAGLSWITILRKRESFREAFDGFEPETIARYKSAKVEKLLQNPGIIRHRGKIEATIGNAKAYLAMMDKGEGFADFLWNFTDGVPVRNKWTGIKQVPAETPMSVAMSKELKKRGFKFCGPTIVYAFAQAVGIVNDHLVTCPRHKTCSAMARIPNQ
ncbi:MAG: DNA-3-methyladenine glycosylase I [Alphaproteobacteria bacterium]|nr:DNA-3-methyladenine glycosylase I [Alphaproteobacteria bacterium]MDX5416750.1 DNA-3-methyladenine glycosylase I [Alphaproteobacteria bacterium]MDX5494134.1 DNA-3-methyladenine glycosylase I [Alphaproteobacteria bacterium]